MSDTLGIHRGVIPSGIRPRVRGDVLIVEDDELLATTLAAAIQDVGFQTRRAGSMAEARVQLAAWLPAVALVDLTLPDGFATDLIDELACKFERPVPVVVVSNFPLAQLVSARWNNLLVRKPFELDEVLETIESLVSRRGDVRQAR